MCYPRLPVGSGLLTRVGVGSSKSSSLVWQAQLWLCPSVTVPCNSRRGQRNLWGGGGGSCQIMIGQLYIFVVSGLYLLLIYDVILCSYFCPRWSLYLFFLFLLIKSPVDSVLLKHLNIRDGSISISALVKYSPKFSVILCLVHCSHHSLRPCLSGTTTGIPGAPALDAEFFSPSSRFLMTSCFETHGTLSFSPCISLLLYPLVSKAFLNLSHASL